MKDIRYYEGIAKGDERKQRMFNFLEHNGYTICTLERKSYHFIEKKERKIQCPHCNYEWISQDVTNRKAMKSNVDVYLATELLTIAHAALQPTHIILVSCDGDYAEMINNALRNEKISVSVLATPPVRNLKLNTLSTKLRALRSNASRYQLINIASIADLIKRER